MGMKDIGIWLARVKDKGLNEHMVLLSTMVVPTGEISH